MESGSAGMVQQVRTLMGFWPARVVLAIFLFLVFSAGSLILVNEITELIDRWVADPRRLGIAFGILVPLAVSLGFLMLSFVCLWAMWQFARNGALGRRVGSLEERVGRLEEQTGRIGRVLGLDDSDSPFG